MSTTKSNKSQKKDIKKIKQFKTNQNFQKKILSKIKINPKNSKKQNVQKNLKHFQKQKKL